MSRISILSIILALLSASAAAKNPRADIMVSYNWHHLTLRNDGEVLTRDYDYLLLANPENSKFFNYQNEYMDSLDSTPSGRAKSRQIMSAAVKLYMEKHDDSAIPHHKGYMWIFKSFPKSETTVYDAYGLMERGYYKEPHAELEWQIGDSVKTVLGYNCTMAETDYHGRHWTVWFTTDIPLRDGPWKLCGLPGLILEASETTGQHSFTATGIEKSDREMFPIYLKSNYDKMKRKDMLKAYAAYRRSADAYTRSILMNPPSGEGIDLSAPTPPKENKLNIDFLETDYHE